MDILILIFEIIGTIAFAISGAITAMKKDMDLLGVLILSFTTALGGGVIRDVLLGINPPTTFTNPLYAFIALLTALIVFLPFTDKVVEKTKLPFEVILLVMDAIGLGIFTVLGVRTAYSTNPDSSIFLLVFLGALTGVGGGVLRDIITSDPPYIFVKHFYASAAIIGAIVCSVILRFSNDYLALICGTVIIIILRLCAAHFHWKLPKHKS